MQDVVAFQGEILFDTSKPDGMIRKVLDVSRIRELGWQPCVGLVEGLARAYSWALRSGKLAESRVATETQAR
jgi:GDP-L-fucose synthase